LSRARRIVLINKNMKKDYHAKLVVEGLPSMKSVTYRRFVDWLDKQVKEFKKADDKKIYAKTYTAKLMK
jgi:hypothetical protein